MWDFKDQVTTLFCTHYWLQTQTFPSILSCAWRHIGSSFLLGGLRDTFSFCHHLWNTPSKPLFNTNQMLCAWIRTETFMIRDIGASFLAVLSKLQKLFCGVNGQKKGSASTSEWTQKTLLDLAKRTCHILLASRFGRVLTQLRTRRVKLNTVWLTGSCKTQEILYLTSQFLLHAKVEQTDKKPSDGEVCFQIYFLIHC